MFTFRAVLFTSCQEFERDYMEGIDKAEYEQKIEAEKNEVSFNSSALLESLFTFKSADCLLFIMQEAKKLLKAELEQKEMKARRRSLGNIRFIGELYNLKVSLFTLSAVCLH